MSKFSFGTTISASAVVHTGCGYFAGILIGTDGVNDATISVYDNTSASGNELVPTTTYDASALGVNGAMLPFPKRFATGVYIAITCAGACEVSPFIVA